MQFKDILIDEKFQFIILILGLVFYILVDNSIKPYIGLLVGIYIISALIIQIKESIKKHGIIKELKELAIIILSLVIILHALKFILNTEVPISAIASCSMVDKLNRGDLIIISNRESPNAEIKVKANLQELSEGKAFLLINNKTFASLHGSIFIYCKSPNNINSELCKDFFSQPYLFSEMIGDITFNYDFCTREINKNVLKEPCVKSVTINNKNYEIKNKGDIIVYRPDKNTLFSNVGDIVHRAVIEIEDKGNVYYLTKGDNNNIFDIQFYNNGLFNKPVKKEHVLGKVIFRIPYLGYYKLFITPYLQEDDYCKAALKN
jgi:signal peptidase I